MQKPQSQLQHISRFAGCVFLLKIRSKRIFAFSHGNLARRGCFRGAIAMLACVWIFFSYQSNIHLHNAKKDAIKSSLVHVATLHGAGAFVEQITMLASVWIFFSYQPKIPLRNAKMLQSNLCLFTRLLCAAWVLSWRNCKACVCARYIFP